MIIVNKNNNNIIYYVYYDNTPARFLGLLSLASAMFFLCLMINEKIGGKRAHRLKRRNPKGYLEAVVLRLRFMYVVIIVNIKLLLIL